MPLSVLAGLEGWRRAGLCVVLGVIAALALPPLDAWPCLFAAIPVVVKLLENIAPRLFRAAFVLGWCFGFGYFLFAFHWIGFAFLVDSKDYLWMMPFAVGGLAAAMAIYWGLAFGAVNLLGWRGMPLVLMFAVAVGCAEILRGVLFTGFPWAAPGLAVDGMGPVAQTASLWGSTGITFLMLVWAGAWPYVLARKVQAPERGVAAVTLILLVAAWSWGSLRLQHAGDESAAEVNLRIVQPNISQDDKWRSDNVRRIFDQLLYLSALPTTNGRPIGLIVWPESAVPFLIDESEGGKAEVAELLGEGRALITGALRREKGNSTQASDMPVFNSVLAFNGQGMVTATYDKWRLVPGGEFLPFEWLLNPLGFRRVVTVPGSFQAGSGPVTHDMGEMPPVGFSICYEAIFPFSFVDESNRPSWPVNVTDDGWFGNSTGPYQHLAQARMRTIEQGLPMVRAANTGVSAIIDSYGRYVSKMELGSEGVLDGALPAPLAATFYSRHGKNAVFSMVLLLLLGGFILQKQARRV